MFLSLCDGASREELLMLREKLPRLIPNRLSPRPTPGDRALYFVVNYDFVLPLKVLTYSLLKTGSFLDLPIVIFTDETKVAEDAFIQSIATKIVFLDKDQKDTLNVIRSDRIPSRLRREDLPKYTFLKWMMFDDVGYKSALFLDADIICLNDATGIFELANHADLVIAPQFKEVIRYHDIEAKVRRSADEVYERLTAMLDARFDEHHQNLNSGVMLMSERLLNRKFREDLIAMARAMRPMPNEQRYLTERFSGTEFSKALMSSKYNFHEMYLNQLDAFSQLQMLSEICLLHYAGPDKPWVKRSKKVAHQIWHQALAELKDLHEFRVDSSDLAHIPR